MLASTPQFPTSISFLQLSKLDQYPPFEDQFNDSEFSIANLLAFDSHAPSNKLHPFNLEKILASNIEVKQLFDFNTLVFPNTASFFVNSIGILLEQPQLIHRLFATDEVLENNQRMIYICNTGEWEKVLIDDTLPCTQIEIDSINKNNLE